MTGRLWTNLCGQLASHCCCCSLMSLKGQWVSHFAWISMQKTSAASNAAAFAKSKAHPKKTKKMPFMKNRRRSAAHPRTESLSPASICGWALHRRARIPALLCASRLRAWAKQCSRPWLLKHRVMMHQLIRRLNRKCACILCANCGRCRSPALPPRRSAAAEQGPAIRLETRLHIA